MTYRKRLKSSAPVFFVVGTLIFAGVEESSAQAGKVYSNCEEMRKDMIAAQVDGCNEASGSFRVEAQRVGYEVESCSWDGEMMGELSRAEAAGFISAAKLAEAEKFYQGVEGSHDLTDLRQFCEWAGCIVDDKVDILGKNDADTIPSVGTWSQHDENIHEAVVNRYEKKWTEDRQNDGTNSRNSSESEYEASREYYSKDFSQRINFLKDKLNSRESPILPGLRAAGKTVTTTVIPGVKEVRRILGNGKLAEKTIREAEKANEISERQRRQRK